MKPPMSPEPCPPTPTKPIAMRLLGAGRPSAPKADAGTKYGATPAANIPFQKQSS